MKKLKLFAIVLVGFAFVFIVSCKKGDTGARGPAGPDSVMYSGWMVLNTPLNTTDSLYKQAITVPSLTSAILSKGVVNSYVGFPNSGDTIVFNIYDPLLQAQVGLISQALFVNEIDLAATNDYSGALFRYVLIPGSVAAGNSILKGYTKEQLQAIDYSTLSKALNISSTKPTN
jgi:hypothetical protein